MKRLIVLAGLLAALLVPAVASAHPLGNFTINHYTRIQPSGDRLYLLYVLDMAEIPTFQAKADVERQGEAAYGASLAARIRENLTLTVSGQTLPLKELRHALAFPHGVGGLDTTRLDIVFDAGPVPAGGGELSYTDDNFPDRLGWKEIVIAPTAGAATASATAPSMSESEELRAYPKDLLKSPLDVTTASAELTPGETAGPPPSIDGKDLDAPAARLGGH